MSQHSRIDLREALYNDRAIGLAREIQLPRDAVARVHGLMVDLDSNLLKPNPWFPPGADARAFFNGIQSMLARHPILQHAEIRSTGRWLHAIVWFAQPVDLQSAADQKRWTGFHQILIASVPSDAAAPSLNSLTRPVGSINSKTGEAVSTLRTGTPIMPAALEEWVKEVMAKPFETIGLPLFGERRIAPCPYCETEDSHLDLGHLVGFCYGPCQHVNIDRLFAAFLKNAPQQGEVSARAQRRRSGSGKKMEETSGVIAAGTPVITIDRDVVLVLEPERVQNIVIRVTNSQCRTEGAK